MNFAVSLLVGVLFGCGTYLILQRSFYRMVLGFGLYTHAANVLLIAMGGFRPDRLAPILTGSGPAGSLPASAYMDPLPPDIILTAIVIAFGTGAFLLALSCRTRRDLGTDDPEKLG